MRKMPKGCKCDPESWELEIIPSVCDADRDDIEDGLICEVCYHDVDCHKNNKKLKKAKSA